MKAAALVLLLPLAGCFDDADFGGVFSGSWCLTMPFVFQAGRLPLDLVRDARNGPLTFDPRLPWDVLSYTNNSRLGAGESIDVTLEVQTPGVEQVSISWGPDGSLRNTRLVVPPQTRVLDFDYTWNFALTDAGCRLTASEYDATGPAGETPHADQGAWVRAAGFWVNGTMFWTNIPSLAGNLSPWPRAPWVQPLDLKAPPLKVYVYDQSPSEQLPTWNLGGPLGMDYVTTIPGFNAALKTVSTSASRVVHVPADQAYTQPGNERHMLYGADLVFFLQIEKVVDLPCASGGFPVCDVPGTDAPRSTEFEWLGPGASGSP